MELRDQAIVEANVREERTIQKMGMNRGLMYLLVSRAPSSMSRAVYRAMEGGGCVDFGRTTTIRLTIFDHTSKLLWMSQTAKKITANIPARLLERAQQTTGLGITETLIAGLEELERSHQRSALRGLRGRVRFELDLEKARR